MTELERQNAIKHNSNNQSKYFSGETPDFVVVGKGSGGFCEKPARI